MTAMGYRVEAHRSIGWVIVETHRSAQKACSRAKRIGYEFDRAVRVVRGSDGHVVFNQKGRTA